MEMMKSARSTICAVLGLGLAVMWTPTGATAAIHIVNPGDSIQAAVDGASAGDVIKVYPGEYIEQHGQSAAVLITKSLKLIARTRTRLGEEVVIKPGPGNTDGIVVRGQPDAYVERVVIKGFKVEGFSNNGIWTEYAHKFTIKNNISANNLENGIWPTLSTRGRVVKNVAYGALDSGLWVEASEDIRVFKNEFYNNPTGLEITVSRNVKALRNEVHDNTVGIGLYHPNGASLPPIGNDGDWIIRRNNVYNNNFPNPVPPGGLVGLLPPGVGVLLAGVDRVTLQHNTITGNDFLGIGLADWCLFVDCDADPPIVEDKTDDNRVIGNTVTGNAGNPDILPPMYDSLKGLARDILVLSGGVGNCFTNNTSGPTIPPSLPPC